ncbi:site-2 protease family protein [Nitrobacter sp. TKz-YC02]|uniref:site-2 protease family protein n=1 Tax=Nitrobacter sp. TKz-YC02 TaxID=3398704 RepID=UPI003CF6D5ED
MYLQWLILVAGTFGVLLIHELGHLVVARFFGLNASGISVGLGPEVIGYTDGSGTRWTMALLPVGGSCTFSDRASALTTSDLSGRAFSDASHSERAMIYVAGPIFNLAFAGIVFLTIICLGGRFSIGSLQHLATTLALLIGGLSASVGLFNLLPLLPMDGGRLSLLAIEACRGRRIAEQEEKQFFRIGLSILAGATLTSALFLFKVIG